MEKNLNFTKILKELFIISLGCAIYSFAIMHFNVPNKLAEGGGTGISLLLLYSIGLPVSIGTILVNIPLLIIGYKMLDKKTMLYTVYGIIMLTFWIGIFEKYNIEIEIGGDRLLAAVFGGIGSIPGAMFGGYVLGLLEAYVKGSSLTTWANPIVFGVLILILIFRPNGLFGKWIEKLGIDRDSANVAIRRYGLYLEAETKGIEKPQKVLSLPNRTIKVLTGQKKSEFSEAEVIEVINAENSSEKLRR